MIEYTVKVAPSGTKKWHLNGKLHREDGPACEYADGDKFWFINGKRHREDGPACEYGNGTEEWYLNGKRHREDGPALKYSDGYCEWHVNGKLHRHGGPAIQYQRVPNEYYLDGKKVTADEANDNSMYMPEIVPPVTQTDKVIEMARASMARNPAFRRGQALMNSLYVVNNALYRELLLSAADPFYDDTAINLFFEAIDESN